jgi:hypothetical protein
MIFVADRDEEFRLFLLRLVGLNVMSSVLEGLLFR